MLRLVTRGRVGKLAGNISTKNRGTNMLTIEKIVALKNQLTELLSQLKAGGKFMFIEYGDPTQPVGSHMSHLRVRYMNTAGGVQFCLKRVSYHVEGSGQYTPDQREIETLAMDAVLHYHRDTVATKLRRKADQAELSWFGADIGGALALREAGLGEQIAAWRLKDLDADGLGTAPAITLTLGD